MTTLRDVTERLREHGFESVAEGGFFGGAEPDYLRITGRHEPFGHHTPAYELRESGELLIRTMPVVLSDPGTMADIQVLLWAAGLLRSQDEPKAEAESDRTFASTDEIMRLNQKIGGHWFSKDTMRSFDSKVYGSVHHGRYFISSEKQDDLPRVYKVRYADPEGRISTLDDQPEFATYKAAWRWLDKEIEAGERLSYGAPVVDARKAQAAG